MNPRTPGATPPPAGGPIGRGFSFPMTPSPANLTTPPLAGGAVNCGPSANQSHASPGMHTAVNPRYEVLVLYVFISSASTFSSLKIM